MRRSTRGFLAAVAILAAVCACLVTAAWLGGARSHVPAGSVLVVDLQGDFPERDAHAALNALLGASPTTLRDVVDGIDAAAEDDSVAALFVRVGFLDVGWAKAREMREAVRRFAETGKPVHAWLEDGNDGTYYVASAAHEVRMIGTGTLWLDGISAEVPFYAGTLQKVGVRADLEQIGEYKNAADSLTRTEMSEAHRESMETLVEGLYGQMVAEMAESLDVSEAEVRDIVSKGPYTALQAVDAGLLDGTSYEDEAEAALDEVLADGSAPRIALAEYVRRRPRARGGPTVAVVTCDGDIMPGESSQGVLGGRTLGSDTVAEAVRAAWEDDGASVVVLRVDSPGGSPVASDVIWRAARRAQEHGVPVVVSMSDVAASGGYWISTGADRVVAEPNTITGSIGIYGGKYVTAGLADLVDMTRVPVERGENAGINSTRRPFTPAQRDWVRTQLRTVYRTFLEKTAEGRHFASADDVDSVARGRVWTGRQAHELGLVDDLGGLREALVIAREVGHLGDGPVTVRDYPRSPTLLETLTGSGPTAGLGDVLRALARRELARSLPPEVAEAVAAEGLLRQLRREGVLVYMPWRVPAR